MCFASHTHTHFIFSSLFSLSISRKVGKPSIYIYFHFYFFLMGTFHLNLIAFLLLFGKQRDGVSTFSKTWQECRYSISQVWCLRLCFCCIYITDFMNSRTMWIFVIIHILILKSILLCNTLCWQNLTNILLYLCDLC